MTIPPIYPIQAYNSPGHGRHAYKPIIDWAQDLLDVCCEELESRHGDIVDAEKRLKVPTSHVLRSPSEEISL